MMENQLYNPWTIDIFGNMDNNNPKFPNDPFSLTMRGRGQKRKKNGVGEPKRHFFPPLIILYKLVQFMAKGKNEEHLTPNPDSKCKNYPPAILNEQITRTLKFMKKYIFLP